MRQLASAVALFLVVSATVVAREQRVYTVREAWRSHASRVTVSGSGTVTKLLRDDREGARHQRFLLDVDGLSILIAHNIDIAPRIASLRRGHRIEFRGEYIWNARGGIVHWTHRDPSRQHPGGWLRRGGELFE